MPPIRSRPASRGAATVPPSLFLITSSERRRPWRPESASRPPSPTGEIDLRGLPEDGPIDDEAAHDGVFDSME